ncbi:hypothetical protein [Pseudogracilibacillus sp. SO30301A]
MYFMANEDSVIYVGVEIDVGVIRIGFMNLIELLNISSLSNR